MEDDSTAMTIEFLRARLLAERSVSRTARQRADELAKRVKELEKQLKIVSLQRKKVEKATTAILAILESHGRSDVSETFDSSSDEEETSSDFKDGKRVETSKNGKVGESDAEGFSGSEIESSSVDGRSLSWKSSKDGSSRCLEKKYMDASRRRRNSFTSTGSSPKRVGKSCRQIRRREHRSAVDGLEKDGKSNAHRKDVGTSSDGIQSSADFPIDASREDLGNQEEKHLPEVPTPSRILENNSETNGHNSNNHGSDGDMKRALERQAQLIGRYEAEEKAQREWEDKFNENNGSTQDSYDPGIHSDVTEEIDETKAPPPPRSGDILTPQSQELDVGAVNANFSEPAKTSHDFQPSSNNEPLRDQINNDTNKPSSSHIDTEPVQDHKSNTTNDIEETLGKSNVLPFTPHENPNKLGSVLEALQQAKIALKQNLTDSPLSEGASYKSRDKFPVPLSSAGLFRLPIDYQYGGSTTSRVDFSNSDSRLSLTSYPTGGQFFSSPYRESPSRSTTSLDDRFHMVPPFPYQEVRLPIPTQRPSGPRLDVGPSAFDPRLDVGPSAFDPRLHVDPSAFDPRLDVRPPLMNDRYMRSVDRAQLTTGLSSSSASYTRTTDGSLSIFRTGRDAGVPPQTRLFFDDYSGPNMYK